MNLSARSIWRAGLGAACLVVVGTCASLSAGATDLAEIKRRGTLVVGTSADYQPFEFVQDGEIVGYDKDVLDRIVAAWGVKLEQLEIPFLGILAGLDQGKYDFVCTALIMNPERAAKYAFTMPVASASVVLLKRRGDDNVKTVDDLSGLRLGGAVPPSGPASVLAAHSETLSAQGKGADEIVHFQTAPDIFLALGNGQIDAAAEMMLVVQEVMRDNPDRFEIVDAIGEPFYIGWVTRPTDTSLRESLNEEIRKLRDSGELARLQQKWFGFTMEIPDSGYLPPEAL
jgi:polar amino acid transport system substrate-binding protein